jgi:methyl halide transferase
MGLQTLTGSFLALSCILCTAPNATPAADPQKSAPQPAPQERWDGAYQDGRLAPWDIGRPSTDLKQAVENSTLRPCRVVELGCGSGNDAIYLAGRGFDVTAIDIAPNALSQAEKKARNAGVKVRWLHADVLEPPELEPFDLIYDRGCYHGVRRQNAAGYVETLRRLSRPGTQVLILAGNANEPPPHYGPPRVREADIRADFGAWFEFQWLRETRFDTTEPNRKGARAWSILLRRKPEAPADKPQ